MADILEQIREAFDAGEEFYAKKNIALRKAYAEIERLRAEVMAERERCARVAIAFGEFPGGALVKDIRVMCGNAIADKIREGTVDPVGGSRE